MPIFHVNLPLGHGAVAKVGYPDLFIERGIHPEIGLDSFKPDTDGLEEVRRLAAGFKSAGLESTVHLPFSAIQPCSEDPEVWQRSLDRMKSCLEAAREFDPVRLVAHAWLDPGRVEASAALAAGFYHEALARWPGHPVLCVENIFEKDPESMLALALAMDSPDMGLCFDVGHWHAFAHGYELENMEYWLETLAGHIRHVHLHDNDGSFDQHLGLGLGRVDWTRFFSLIKKLDIRPTVTMEPHTEEDYLASIRFLREFKDPLDWNPR